MLPESDFMDDQIVRERADQAMVAVAPILFPHGAQD